MLTAIIVDDQPEFIEILKDQLMKINRQIVILDTCNDADNGFLSIKKNQPDIVFLDVEMPGKSGLDLANDFKDRDFDIIFTTSHDKYAVKAFKVDAIDYLVKPVNVAELSNAIDKVFERREQKSLITPVKFNVQQKQKISISSLECMEFIELNSIFYCEADNSYTTFFLEGNKKIVCTKSLKEFEELLSNHGFFRIQKSFLINLAYVSKYIRGNGGMVVMSNGKTLPVSRKAKEELLIKLSEI